MNSTVVLLGLPISGKGALVNSFRKQNWMPSVFPNGLLRDEKEISHEVGIEADILTREGELAPDSLVNSLAASWLQINTFSDGCVSHGYPRTTTQAGRLSRSLDDTTETFELLLCGYKKKSAPLISYYGKRDLIYKINSERSAEQIFTDVSQIFNN